MKRIFLCLCLLVATIAGWGGYGYYLGATMPKAEILAVSSLPVQGEKTLPFYELMSPLPPLGGSQLVPRLEYKKGPPERYIEKITLLLQSGKGLPKERVVYHGRRTRTDFPGLSLFGGPEASYLETALRLSQGQPSGLEGWREFLLKPFLLREASKWLQLGTKSIQIMDQAGTPAFFFSGESKDSGRIRSTALFIRRNSFYRVDYIGDRGFVQLNPEDLFRKSFLTETRGDAMEFLARNLSEVRLEQKEASDVRSIVWPILLLAANVSVDPASLDAYFHFAGISALLYRSVSMDQADSEVLDILRNNVLASAFYAKDVDPDSRKTSEIARLARLLTRKFE